MYKIEYVEGITGDLVKLRAYDRKRIVDRLEKRLRYEPTKKTKNKKPLPCLIPPWDYIEPVWELRVGENRVFYDVDEESSLVMVRAIRHKALHKTTEEIL